MCKASSVKNVEALVDLLIKKDINDDAGLQNLVCESYRRDGLRAVFQGVVRYSSFMLATIGNAANVAVTGRSPLSMAPFGDAAAAAGMSFFPAVFRPGLPKYHPQRESGPQPYEMLSQSGASAIDYAPFDIYTAASVAANSISDLAGLTALQRTILNVSFGVAAGGKRGYDAWVTSEAVRTRGGSIKEQPWLDADDLKGTENAINHLKQSPAEAMQGFMVDMGRAVKERSLKALMATMVSPRPLALWVCLWPAEALYAASRAAALPTFQESFTNPDLALASFENMRALLTTLAIKNRMNVEYYISRATSGIWTHSKALIAAGLVPRPSTQDVLPPSESMLHIDARTVAGLLPQIPAMPDDWGDVIRASECLGSPRETS
jgi:hypothetical protein